MKSTLNSIDIRTVVFTIVFIDSIDENISYFNARVTIIIFNNLLIFILMLISKSIEALLNSSTVKVNSKLGYKMLE